MPVATVPAWANGSGTSRLPGSEGTLGGCGQPASAHAPGGLHAMSGDWMLMAHGYVWPVYTDQSGPRGDDKIYAQSMVMLSASGPIGEGVNLELRTMLSAEPLMDNAGYPNLFATGETDEGEPLVDRQHPHDLFMELAARVNVDIGGSNQLFLYGGPVAEPALGPSAFMHRGSATYNPEAPITHHWFDSTHITYGVVTAGYSSSRFQLEASAFRGREPDEERWGIETPRLDSWSIRGTWNASRNWATQLSYGRINEPEALHPGEDEGRFTASVHYSGWNGLSAMAAFSAKNRIPGPTLEAFLIEANWNIDNHHTVFGRFENVENDELFDHDSPLHEIPYRISKFQAGYAYRLPLADNLNVALGGTVSAFAFPNALEAAYGDNPMGFTLFARFALGR
ncbi:hypothetical protein H6P80_07410 [Parasphingopyxis sp. GrpM-11]|uniref:Alginate export domain-containing protein n=1 Tax=Parasphingopyxis marina TaxID=2761622 RepID=A0A842HYB5_9SPHN|nr:hypothetical protein [Parasphingopyxis marina]